MVSTRLLHQVAFAANDPQLLLVGRGQVDGARGNGRAQVARVGDFQVCSGRGPADMGRETEIHLHWCWAGEENQPLAQSRVCLVRLPQGGAGLDFDDFQGVEVRHEQVGLSVGCGGSRERPSAPHQAVGLLWSHCMGDQPRRPARGHKMGTSRGALLSRNEYLPAQKTCPA